MVNWNDRGEQNLWGKSKIENRRERAKVKVQVKEKRVFCEIFLLYLVYKVLIFAVLSTRTMPNIVLEFRLKNLAICSFAALIFMLYLLNFTWLVE